MKPKYKYYIPIPEKQNWPITAYMRQQGTSLTCIRFDGTIGSDITEENFFGALKYKDNVKEVKRKEALARKRAGYKSQPKY